MKSFLRVLLVAGCAAWSGVGCGGGGEAENSNENVRFWHAMGGKLGKSLDGLVSDYNSSTTGLALVNEPQGNYTALVQKIMASVAAGGPPSLAQCYEAWTANLIDNESVVPLTKFVAGSNGISQEELRDFYPLFLEGATQRGELWSFPFNKSVRILYYNKDAFRDAGLDPNRPPKDWQEYREMARKLTRDRDGDGDVDFWGVASQITVSMFENLIVQNGGRLVKEDGSGVAFDSPEGLEALEFMEDLLVNDGSALLSRGFEYQNDFLAGNVAMIEGSSVSLAFIEGKYSFELGIAPLPAGKFDTQLAAGTDVVVFASTPTEEEAAWSFIRWFTDTDQTARWCAETGYLPVRKSAMKHPTVVEKLAKYPGLEEAYGQLDRAQPQPQARGWYAGRQILEREAIEPVLRRKLSPKEALANAARKADEEFASANSSS